MSFVNNKTYLLFDNKKKNNKNIFFKKLIEGL